MQITLNSLTALRIIRAARAGQIPVDLDDRCSFVAPDPAPHKSWTRSMLAQGLESLGAGSLMDAHHPLDVLVSDRDRRLRTQGVNCSYRVDRYPEGAFVRAADGIAISGPEFVFVELARVMDPALHLLLGMELCGRFVRSAADPRGGEVTYGVEPVTTVERLRAFASEASWIRGARKAQETIDRIVENAWSPMEALVAALLVLPVWELGYDLWPITLNPRKELPGELVAEGTAASRVPDIMFSGTHVGINYDGEDHFLLGGIVDAATRLAQEPGDAHAELELEEALEAARGAIVEDKRRDRDLMALGLSVLSVTKEDLTTPGALDAVVERVVAAIETEGSRKLTNQRTVLQNKRQLRPRQELIWSLMPGPRAQAARERLKARESSNPTIAYEGPISDLIDYVDEDGHERTVAVGEV